MTPCLEELSIADVGRGEAGSETRREDRSYLVIDCGENGYCWHRFCCTKRTNREVGSADGGERGGGARCQEM